MTSLSVSTKVTNRSTKRNRAGSAVPGFSAKHTTNYGQGSPKFQFGLFFFIFIFYSVHLLNNVKKTLVIQKQIVCGKRYSKCNIKQNNLTVQ